MREGPDGRVKWPEKLAEGREWGPEQSGGEGGVRRPLIVVPLLIVDVILGLEGREAAHFN